jgi:hypothetical protein
MLPCALMKDKLPSPAWRWGQAKFNKVPTGSYCGQNRREKHRTANVLLIKKSNRDFAKVTDMIGYQR